MNINNIKNEYYDVIVCDITIIIVFKQFKYNNGGDISKTIS